MGMLDSVKEREKRKRMRATEVGQEDEEVRGGQRRNIFRVGAVDILYDPAWKERDPVIAHGPPAETCHIPSPLSKVAPLSGLRRAFTIIQLLHGLTQPSMLMKFPVLPAIISPCQIKRRHPNRLSSPLHELNREAAVDKPFHFLDMLKADHRSNDR